MTGETTAKPPRARGLTGSDCPIAPVIDIVFSRWTAPIVRTLGQYGRQRFTELQARLDGITPKVLTERLRRLERDGLVTRTCHAEIPPRMEYEISDLGRGLDPVFAALGTWSATGLDAITRARAGYDARH